MLRETLKWRGEYHPEQLCWDNIQHEGARGKLFILDHPDNDGRPVVLMRPRWVPAPPCNWQPAPAVFWELASPSPRFWRAVSRVGWRPSRWLAPWLPWSLPAISTAGTLSHCTPPLLPACLQAGAGVQRRQRRARQVAGVHAGAGQPRGRRLCRWAHSVWRWGGKKGGRKSGLVLSAALEAGGWLVQRQVGSTAGAAGGAGSSGVRRTRLLPALPAALSPARPGLS